MLYLSHFQRYLINIALDSSLIIVLLIHLYEKGLIKKRVKIINQIDKILVKIGAIFQNIYSFLFKEFGKCMPRVLVPHLSRDLQRCML